MDLAEFIDQFDTKEKLTTFINDFEKAGRTINQQAQFIVNSVAAFKQLKANLIKQLQTLISTCVNQNCKLR